MLRNPGPATSTLLIPGVSPSRAAIAVATSRGGLPACLASWSAMLVAQSPCSRTLGRSTLTEGGTATASSPEATDASRAARMAADSSAGVTCQGYRSPRAPTVTILRVTANPDSHVPRSTAGAELVVLRAARRSGLIDQVIEQLRGQIESGRWAVGNRIPTEAELAASTGTSRNTVREAVQSLVHAGLLERRQGSGTYVLAS